MAKSKYKFVRNGGHDLHRRYDVYKDGELIGQVHGGDGRWYGEVASGRGVVNYELSREMAARAVDYVNTSGNTPRLMGS